MMRAITDDEITNIEHKLLPKGSGFSVEAKEILKCMESKEIVACPGSGKTTVLMAKLDLLAARLPFENNRGICVLSHTNVAIDEIKNRLGDKAKLILNYPNYVGTIQSFIHKFIVKTYLITKYKAESLIVLEDARYEEELWRTYLRNISALTSLKAVINRKVSQSSRISSEKEFLASLYLDEEGKLKSVFGGHSLANKGTKTNKQFTMLNKLMRHKGVISYKEAYTLTGEAIIELGEIIKELLNLRFQFVFIDEYQDCSRQQVDIIDFLFKDSNTVIQKIGDCDQAIYSSVQAEDDSIWNVSESALKLKGSNRYHQKIADVLNKLNTSGLAIESLTSIEEITPILFVYEPQAIDKVLTAFAEEIMNNNLNEKTVGVYKAVGMIKNGTGITIGNYYSEYQLGNIQKKKELCLDDFIYQMYEVKNQGTVATILKQVIEVFLRVFYLVDKKDTEGKNYTASSLYRMLCEFESFKFKEWMLEIVELIGLDEDNQDANSVKSKIIEIIEHVLDDEELSKVETFISDSPNSAGGVLTNSTKKNVWAFENENGEKVEVEIATVHKVKGETHSATLYLETETASSSDLKRIISLFQGRQLDKRPIYEKSRKIAYVGMSRPTHLLCVAMQKETYIGNEEAFVGWNVRMLNND